MAPAQPDRANCAIYNTDVSPAVDPFSLPSSPSSIFPMQAFPPIQHLPGSSREASLTSPHHQRRRDFFFFSFSSSSPPPPVATSQPSASALLLLPVTWQAHVYVNHVFHLHLQSFIVVVLCVSFHSLSPLVKLGFGINHFAIYSDSALTFSCLAKAQRSPLGKVSNFLKH